MIRLSENIVELHYVPDKEEEQTSILFWQQRNEAIGPSIPSLTKIRQIQSQSAPNNMKALGKLNQEVWVLLHFKANKPWFLLRFLKDDLKGTGYSVSEKFQHKSRELFILFEVLACGALQKDTNYMWVLQIIHGEKENKLEALQKTECPPN
jgi:hypothetical protein